MQQKQKTTTAYPVKSTQQAILIALRTTTRKMNSDREISSHLRLQFQENATSRTRATRSRKSKPARELASSGTKYAEIKLPMRARGLAGAGSESAPRRRSGEPLRCRRRDGTPHALRGREREREVDLAPVLRSVFENVLGYNPNFNL